jgi:hypothetical protein
MIFCLKGVVGCEVEYKLCLNGIWSTLWHQQAKPFELNAVTAIKIRLSKGAEKLLNVAYRVYKGTAWQNWVKNGEIAGTNENSCTAIEVKIYEEKQI